jgi:hypothetical protein
MDVKVLRSDFEALRKNAVWEAFLVYLKDRENYYVGQLASGAINDAMSQGVLWQGMIKEIKKFRDYPERLLTPQE